MSTMSWPRETKSPVASRSWRKIRNSRPSSASDRSSTHGDYRTASRRDVDKVLYSPSFARLGDVTQVITPFPTGQQTHNRLTHSLKVAQVAKSIAEMCLDRAVLKRSLAPFGGVDPDVAEAAALAHDLGHPPFGHIGEHVLDESAKALGLRTGYEGNAQTFRIATRLERHSSGVGLNLTHATLTALLKYPWTRRIGSDGFPEPGEPNDLILDRLRQNKYCSYGIVDASPHEQDDSWELFLTCMDLVPRDHHGRPRQSVEAAIMDIADDITYAIHDLEDFYRAGLIKRPAVLRIIEDWKNLKNSQVSRLDRSGMVLQCLATKLRKEYPDRFRENIFREAVDQVRNDVLPAISENTYSGTFDQDANLHIMTGIVISQCLKGLRVSKDGELCAPVLLSPHDWHLVAVLKELTKHFVVQTPGLAGIQRGQAKLLQELVDLVYRWVSDEGDRAPSRIREYIENSVDSGITEPLSRARAVIDYLAGLTDFQAIELHELLTGRSSDLAPSILL